MNEAERDAALSAVQLARQNERVMRNLEFLAALRYVRHYNEIYGPIDPEALLDLLEKRLQLV